MESVESFTTVGYDGSGDMYRANTNGPMNLEDDEDGSSSDSYELDDPRRVSTLRLKKMDAERQKLYEEGYWLPECFFYPMWFFTAIYLMTVWFIVIFYAVRFETRPFFAVEKKNPPPCPMMETVQQKMNKAFNLGALAKAPVPNTYPPDQSLYSQEMPDYMRLVFSVIEATLMGWIVINPLKTFLNTFRQFCIQNKEVAKTADNLCEIPDYYLKILKLMQKHRRYTQDQKSLIEKIRAEQLETDDRLSGEQLKKANHRALTMRVYGF